jgi:acetylornithine deacetylase
MRPSQQSADQHRRGARRELGIDRARVAGRRGADRADSRRGSGPVPRVHRGADLGVAAQNQWLVENPPTLEWFGGQFAPAEVPADAPICRAVMAAHERVTGAPPTVAGVPYGADMRLFIRLGEMPCVMYGAGDVNHAHRADEHISIPELLTATRTIAHLLIDWCGVAE